MKVFGPCKVVALCLLVGCIASGADAQPTTERAASLLIFPKVVADGPRDTVIQISNVSNVIIAARCFYVDVRDPLNWVQLEFAITLTRQQPTSWVVSRGRPVVDDPLCSPTNADCEGAGLDPGAVPPVPAGFRGELLCVESDLSGAPIAADHLQGEATVKDVSTGDLAKYNGIGIGSGSLADGDNVLSLDGSEYEPCPESWVLNHVAEGAEDSLVGAGSSVSTVLTVVPCSQDLAAQQPATVPLLFSVFDEFEMQLSASTTISGWADMPLSAINDLAFNVTTRGTSELRTRIQTPASEPGAILVAQEFHASGPPASLTTSAGVNLHIEGTRSTADFIVLPGPP